MGECRLTSCLCFRSSPSEAATLTQRLRRVRATKGRAALKRDRMTAGDDANRRLPVLLMIAAVLFAVLESILTDQKRGQKELVS